MELKTFFSSFDHYDFLADKSVLCFRSKQEYPILFFSSILKKFKQNIALEIIDIEEQEFTQIVAQLQTSFLGTRVLYWLRNVSVLNKNKKDILLNHIHKYQGPNIIAFFATYEDVPKVAATWTEISIPDEIDEHMYEPLMRHVFNTPSHLIDSIGKQYKQLPLDTLCLLGHYDAVLGKNSKQFVEEWLDQLIVPQASLFNLSKHFFSKDARAFFPCWINIAHVYTPQFWVVFWSEQLWRASGFIMFSRKKQYSDAKQIAFRLPFTFLQKDWRAYSVRELKNAHQFVYSSDYALKHGGSTVVLDLFFSKFFCNQFI